MADNRNFDSVFADCTKDELEFDAIFDEEDDLLVDLVAGVDEAGIPLTGEDFDFNSLHEADDMVGEKPDFDYQKDGDAAYDLKDAEGTKDKKPEIGGEVGDGKEVSGKEDSAMSNAYEVTKKIDDAIGANDKQQLSLESDVLDLLKEEDDQYSNDDKSPIADDDAAFRSGEKEQSTGEDQNVEETTDYLLSMLEDADEVASDDADDEVPTGSEDECGALCKESGEEDLCPECGKNPCECSKNEGCECDPLTDLPDEEARAGATCAKATDAPEVDKVEEAFIDNMLDLLNEEDSPIDDEDDAKMRDGSADRDDKNVEGVGTEDLGASLESTLLDLLNEEDDPITDQDDSKMRDGSAKRPTGDVEGVGTDVIGASINGDSSKDPIEDTCDCGERQGAIKHSTSDVEGVGTKVVGAALESDNVDDLLAAVEDDDDVDIDAVIDVDDVVGDEVQQDGSNNAEIKTNEAASNIDDIVTDIDDDDIKEVEDNTGSDAEIEYSEDDDDLINAVMNGLDID